MLGRWPRRIYGWVGLIVLANLVATLTPSSTKAANQELAELETATFAVAPVIDGNVGLDEWVDAAIADQNFVQIEPNYGAPSPYRTIVRVGQTATALYVAIEALDPEIQQLAAAITQRDGDLLSDDSIAIMLDPFADGRAAYVFRANALATQQDGRIANNGATVDLQWDGAWRSAAARLDDRWTVEFEIPFSTLLYPQEEQRIWRVNFVRIVPRRLETAVWSGPSESVFRVSGFGELASLEPPGREEDVWQFIPYGVGSFEIGEGSHFEFGGDIRWRQSTTLGVDLTVNPDFALVEADVEEINLTRLELSVPEKRPFFLEGTEMYDQRYPQFHTRRIGDIIWGGKANGRLGSTDFSVITASEKLRPEGSEEKKPAYYGIFRAQRSLPRGSTIGVLATNRSFENENVGTVGADATLYFTDTISFTGQFFRVHGPTADGGLAWFVRPSYDTSTTHFHVRYAQFSPNIRDDLNVLGFLPEDDRKEIDTNFGHTMFGSGLFERVRGSVNFGYGKFFSENRVRRWALVPRVTVVLRNNFEFQFERRDEKRGADPELRVFKKDFRNHQTKFTAGWNARDGRAVTAYVGGGHLFDNDALQYGGQVQWAFGDSLRLLYNVSRLDLTPDLEHESTTIHVFEATYTFNPDLFVRAFVQTNSAIEKENVQLLGVWRFNPPFGSFQLAYQRGTSAFGERSGQSDTLFSKLVWVL